MTQSMAFRPMGAVCPLRSLGHPKNPMIFAIWDLIILTLHLCPMLVISTTKWFVLPESIIHVVRAVIGDVADMWPNYLACWRSQYQTPLDRLFLQLLNSSSSSPLDSIKDDTEVLRPSRTFPYDGKD